ncbi:TerB family tellurite resistance protein [Aliivibrio finisterrensis]|uniref:TerB family tellurite resistance protein n=1 Tax=Aliivibrio finisterrensis TaxID=511998 RepID=A0A6N6RPL5_9GAMM|nr:TerB family tellurite resistance protein [Aliivibrio finisterrensis]KAB2823470.1 TerB family tellurite resistance protein [Aliivibrio finisterrensis]
MFKKLSTLLKKVMHEASDGSAGEVASMHLAMASLLCEVSGADHQNDEREDNAKLQLLSKLFDINDEQAKSLLLEATAKSKASTSLYEFTTKLRALMPNERYDLIEAMWTVAYADGVIEPMEEAVIRQVSDLIYLDHLEFIRAKLAAAPQA